MRAETIAAVVAGSVNVGWPAAALMGEGRTMIEAVRITLGPPSTRSALEEGLNEIVRIMNRVPEAYELVV